MRTRRTQRASLTSHDQDPHSGILILCKDWAASYSPGGLRPEYHRRWRA